MTTDTTIYHEPDPELRRRAIPAGEARVAVFTRTYQTTIEDLWDACTSPERLRRWYVPVTGNLRVGGSFQQVNMGSGTILVCEAPELLKLSLGGGADEIELRLSPGPQDRTTTLELQHATTLDAHNIGGPMYDAIFCMGGGYYPACWHSTCTCAAPCPTTTTPRHSTTTPTCVPRSNAAAAPWPPSSRPTRAPDSAAVSTQEGCRSPGFGDHETHLVSAERA